MVSSSSWIRTLQDHDYFESFYGIKEAFLWIRTLHKNMALAWPPLKSKDNTQQREEMKLTEVGRSLAPANRARRNETIPPTMVIHWYVEFQSRRKSWGLSVVVEEGSIGILPPSIHHHQHQISSNFPTNLPILAEFSKGTQHRAKAIAQNSPHVFLHIKVKREKKRKMRERKEKKKKERKKDPWVKIKISQ